MLSQLDLRIEARNLKRFRRDFADDPQVEFPQPVMDLTTEKVLVEAFIHGEPILNYCDEGRKEKKDREHLAKIGLETVMKMIFLYDFVHGDLHPGSYSFSVLLLLAFVSLFSCEATIIAPLDTLFAWINLSLIAFCALREFV